MSKFSGKFRDYDYEDEYTFETRKKKRNQQKAPRRKSYFEDDDYFRGYEDYQKPTRRKARHFD